MIIMYAFFSAMTDWIIVSHCLDDNDYTGIFCFDNAVIGVSIQS